MHSDRTCALAASQRLSFLLQPGQLQRTRRFHFQQRVRQRASAVRGICLLRQDLPLLLEAESVGPAAPWNKIKQQQPTRDIADDQDAHVAVWLRPMLEGMEQQHAPSMHQTLQPQQAW